MSEQEQIDLEELLADPKIIKAQQESFIRMVEEDTRNDQHQ